jgi:hypothetical protein
MPETWRCWEEPAPPLPIDLQISRLAERKRRPHLERRARLERLGIRCPYWHAREATYMAAEAAMFAASQEHRIEPDGYSEPAQLALGTFKAQRAVAELQVLWRHTELSVASGRIADLLSEIENELAGVKAYLARRYSMRETSVGEPWKGSFVRHLAVAWEDLTGAGPRGREFLGFVAATWHSLSDDIPATSWDRAIYLVLAAKQQAEHRMA